MMTTIIDLQQIHHCSKSAMGLVCFQQVNSKYIRMEKQKHGIKEVMQNKKTMDDGQSMEYSDTDLDRQIKFLYSVARSILTKVTIKTAEESPNQNQFQKD